MAAFKLSEAKESIFHIPQTYSLAHAVSADLDTVRGTLAWQFQVIFGEVDQLHQQQVQRGNVAVLENNSRYVYYLITKQTLYGQSTYDSLEAALICMREHMRNHQVLKVAIPRLCCGNDKLQWQQVKVIISKVFANEYGVEILICNYTAPELLTPQCKILEVKGNVFSAPSDYSLVHCVSADFAMCKGINLQFKCKFGQVRELLKQNKHSGNLAVVQDKNRFIYNLVTKEHNHEKCTYPALYYSLCVMREHMLEHNVTKLAVPHLGCGIDRLNWLQVKKILQYVFNNDNVEIVAYIYTSIPALTSEIKEVHIH